MTHDLDGPSHDDEVFANVVALGDYERFARPRVRDERGYREPSEGHRCNRDNRDAGNADGAWSHRSVLRVGAVDCRR